MGVCIGYLPGCQWRCICRNLSATLYAAIYEWWRRWRTSAMRELSFVVSRARSTSTIPLLVPYGQHGIGANITLFGSIAQTRIPRAGTRAFSWPWTLIWGLRGIASVAGFPASFSVKLFSLCSMSPIYALAAGRHDSYSTPQRKVGWSALLSSR